MMDFPKVLTAMGIASFIAGVGISYLFSIEGVSFAFGLGPVLDLVFITAGIFVLSMGFFGYGAPVVMLLTGLAYGNYVISEPIAGIATVLPMVIALYAGANAGNLIHLDLQGKANLYEHLGGIGRPLAVAVVLAVAVGFLAPGLPALPEIAAAIGL